MQYTVTRLFNLSELWETNDRLNECFFLPHRSSNWRSLKKAVLKNLQYSQENTCGGVEGLKTCNYIKKRFNTDDFL